MKYFYSLLEFYRGDKMKNVYHSNSIKDYNESRLAMALVAPVFLYLLIIMLLPFLWALYTSLTNKMVGAEGIFVGLKNYIELVKDALFLKSIKNTLIFTSLAVIAKVVLGMVMALILNENIKSKNLFRALLMLPWTIPTLVSVFAWQWIFSDVGGVLNFILVNLGIVKQQVGWLATPALGMFSVILVNVWRGVPFLGISILSGLQTVDGALYEAATIDGANSLQRFINITLPSVRDVIILASIVTTIWTLGDFEIIWLLTRGGPSNGTQVISTLSYTYGFLNLYLGKAIAISVFSFPPLIALVHFMTKKTLETEG